MSDVIHTPIMAAANERTVVPVQDTSARHACAVTPGLPRVVILSSRLLTDRMFLYTGCLRTLAAHTAVSVWSTSSDHPTARELCHGAGAEIEPYPVYEPERERYDCLRRLNDFAWDHRLKPPSRISRFKHLQRYTMPRRYRALRSCARVIAWLGLEQRFEDSVERLLVTHQTNRDAIRRFRSLKPACLVATNPLSQLQPGTVGAAKAQGIPVLAMIPSWDNLSTKQRLIPRYDGYIVWSEEMKRQLHVVYPRARLAPVYVCGAPQFDIFHQERFQQSREEFCADHGLSPVRPIVVYALGSPYLDESPNATYVAERVRDGTLGNAQLLIRPHPNFDPGKGAALLKAYGPGVVVQRVAATSGAYHTRFHGENEIRQWVNTFRHADVVVNLASTATIDAAVCDRPVVNIDYDPAPGRQRQRLIHDINHVWTHFKPVAESGGVWLAQSPDEMIVAIQAYLRRPELHRERRRWIIDYVCQYNDGRCGDRLAAAIIHFSSHRFPRATDGRS